MFTSSPLLTWVFSFTGRKKINQVLLFQRLNRGEIWEWFLPPILCVNHFMLAGKSQARVIHLDDGGKLPGNAVSSFVPVTVRFFEDDEQWAKLNSWSTFYSKPDKQLNEHRSIISWGVYRVGVGGVWVGCGWGLVIVSGTHLLLAGQSLHENKPTFLGTLEEMTPSLLQTLK